MKREKVDLINLINYTKDTEWLKYILPKVNTYSCNEQVAFCSAQDGICEITIHDNWIKQGGTLLVELIKHEIAHGYFGHLKHMKGNEYQRKLLNVLFDCSIHTNAANPEILKQLGKPATYSNCKLPVLPPLVLYGMMKSRVKEKDFKDMINMFNNYNATWKYGKSISEVEQQVISHAIEQGIHDAIKDGVKIPDKNFPGLEGGVGHVDNNFEYAYKKVKKPKWVDELRKELSNHSQKYKRLSWRREPKNTIAPNILKKGYAPVKGEHKFLFAIDCSYSVKRELIETVCNIISDVATREGMKGECMFFDSEVSETLSIHAPRDEILKLASKYGGGTAFKPVLDAATPLDKVIFITDGYAHDLDKLESYKNKFKSDIVFVLTELDIHDYYTDYLRNIGKIMFAEQPNINDWTEAS